MRIILFFWLLTCLFYGSTYGQFDYIIDDNAIGVHNVCTADMDDDGDLDVLSASFEDDTVAWYENIDGQGNNWFKHIITDQAAAVHHVCPGYLDGDGDMDVLYASYLDDTIAWGENDGLGNFTEHIITDQADGVHEVFLADFNGDGYLDVLSAMVDGKKLVSFENNGSGNFIECILPAGDEYFMSIYAADLDGDGDMDVLSGSAVLDPVTDEAKVVWYENTDGLGTFVAHPPLFTGSNTIWAVSASDLDGDGDQDILASIDGATNLVWYENTDGLGNFVEVVQIPTPYWVMSIHPVDFDEDGDMDILCAEYGGPGFITMFVNDGSGNFTKAWVTSGAEGAISAVAAHINNDGAIDYVSGWSEADKVVLTSSLIGIEENTLSNLSVYPNPTTGVLHIQSETAIAQIKVYNQLGQLVLFNTNQNTIDVSSTSQGVYFIKISGENGKTITKKLIKE